MAIATWGISGVHEARNGIAETAFLATKSDHLRDEPTLFAELTLNTHLFAETCRRHAGY